MTLVHQTWKDINLLNRLLASGLPESGDQPPSYEGVAVLKPWGYELQLFDNGRSCIWLACLRSGHAVSMHCHQRKRAVFIPLTDGIRLSLLDRSEALDQSVTVERGVFHSQENPTGHDCFFLEYESPSEKSDLVRYKDRYGRETQGYEGTNRMVPIAEMASQMPEKVRLLVEVAA